MHPNPNKLLCFLFSLIPGAGHMYLGLMKRGLSFMAAFIGCLVAAILFSFMNLHVIFVPAMPIIWFLAFFDFWRYPRMSPDEKFAVRDDFLLSDRLDLPKAMLSRRLRIVVGVVLILAGAHRLYSQYVWRIDWSQISAPVAHLLQSLPTLIGALMVIAAGLLLIFWKAKQIKREAVNEHEE